MQPRIFGLAVIVACGGADSSNKVPTSDASPTDTSSQCKAQTTYPDFGSNVRGYGLDYPTATTGSATTAHAQVVVQTLNGTDVMFIQLNAEFGAFGSGEIVPGNYVIADDDLDPARCGICVNVWPSSLSGTSLDAVTKTYLMNERYIAIAGAVALTTAGGSANGSNTISGTVSNVSFKHAIIQSDGTFQYSSDACATTLGSGSFGPYKLTLSGSGSGSAAPDSEIHANGFDMPADAIKLRRRSVD